MIIKEQNNKFFRFFLISNYHKCAHRVYRAIFLSLFFKASPMGKTAVFHPFEIL